MKYMNVVKSSAMEGSCVDGIYKRGKGGIGGAIIKLVRDMLLLYMHGEPGDFIPWTCEVTIRRPIAIT
jgi:hypothetical protein